MSINFSDEGPEQVLTTAAFRPEDATEASLRPKRLEDYTGQEKAKDNLAVFCATSRWTTCCSTAPRAWARPPWPASSPTRWA